MTSSGEYELPFLAHATMEPLNCTVHVTPGSCQVWTGTQVLTRGVQEDAAKAAGLPLDKVTAHNHLLGGGVRAKARRHGSGSVRIAETCRWAGKSRLEPCGRHPARHLSPGLSRCHLGDFVQRQDRCLEVSCRRLVNNGALAAARSRAASISMPSTARSIIPTTSQISGRICSRRTAGNLPTGFWRGVGPNANVFATECFMDELARKANADPIAFRIGMLDKNPRLSRRSNLLPKNQGGVSRFPGSHRSRCMCAAVVWQFHRHGGRSRS